MKIDITSLCFGFKITKENDSGTPAWATSIGQAPKNVCYIETSREGLSELVYGMMYNAHSDFENLKVRDVPGVDKKEEPRSDRERMMFSVFQNVYVNDKKVDGIYTLTYEREDSDSHKNRIHICYAKYLTYKGHSNKQTLQKMAEVLGCSAEACWFVKEINVVNQTQLHFTAVVVNPTSSMIYSDSKSRKQDWDNIDFQNCSQQKATIDWTNSPYRPYITAIKSKPFLLLAGISGTGKSRIVRELARSCWSKDSDEYKSQKPSNFEMVQVKPNWHDSSELVGYVSRINGRPEYIVGDFLKFVAKAWDNWKSNDKKPYFLCLDEMNLAPVEQYFAEYLSVVESRKVAEDGSIIYDPIVKNDTEGFDSLLNKIAWQKQELNDMFEAKGVCLPPNLIVVGTVNMDETTFSFSRKVLDRAMTIEMNEVDLQGGLTTHYEPIGRQSIETLIGTAVEGVDIYENNKDVCDKCIVYLEKVNAVLDGTPFKVAYRTRNEVLLYVVNNLPYTKEEDGTERSQDYVIARALDEITNMKILSRIEGDESKVTSNFLENLQKAICTGLTAISSLEYAAKAKKSEEDSVADIEKSISLSKLAEMKEKLKSGYTSFWS